MLNLLYSTRQMPHSTSLWNISGQSRGPIRVSCGMISIPIWDSKTLTLTPTFFSPQDSNAEKKSKQNRSQNRRQRRTRTSPQAHFISQHHLHFHHHRHHLLLRRPPRPVPAKPHLQITTHRPLLPLKPTSTMEVEVKLRLKDSSAHRHLTTLLSTVHVGTLNQHNLFFDTPTSSLSSKRAVLRLRFLDKDARCIVSLKAKPTLVDGVSRVEEDEEEVDPKAARECVENPSKLFDLESRVVRRVREEFGVEEESGNGLVCLGGFENVREVFEWRGLKLEVDETKYAFGTSYEVECETGDPEAAKTLLEELLNDNGIVYVYSEMTKFAVFRAGRVPQ